MRSLSPDALARLEAFKLKTVSPGDVFYVPEPLAAYFDSPSARPAVLLRVLRSAAGEATLGYLVYGTTKSVPARRALPVAAGEGGLPKDTTFDFGPQLELPVSVLLSDCDPLGRLSEAVIDEVETALAASRLPFRSLPK